MTTNKRRDTHTWLNIARHSRRAVVQRYCCTRALKLSNDPYHTERICAARASVGTKQFRYDVLLAMAWLEIENHISALDFGPGCGIGFTQMMRR